MDREKSFRENAVEDLPHHVGSVLQTIQELAHAASIVNTQCMRNSIPCTNQEILETITQEIEIFRSTFNV